MKATRIHYKTKNQIFNDFICLVAAALEAFEITGWEIRQLRQIFKINHLKPVVFISILSANQLGRQYTKKQHTGNEISRINSTKQEIKIRFSATRRGLETDTLETFDGVDILKTIKEFMQSDEGIQFLSNLGYAQYRAETVSEMNFTNDSDNFQFLPYFDCTFLYTDSWKTNINKVSKFNHTGIYRI